METYRISAAEGKRFVLTQKGYDKTPDVIKYEREAGKPVKGFEVNVPGLWVEKGYVIEK